MMRFLTYAAAVIMVSACYTAPNIRPAPGLSGNYTLDPAHASVTWSLSHAGLSQYTARFDTLSGILDYNATSPELSRVDIRIDAASVNTGLPDFDETIAYDPRYFGAKTYPEIRYVSGDIKKLSDTKGIMSGDLTFRGQTHPVTLNVTFNGAGTSFGHLGKTLGFSASGKLKRSDFGLTYLSNFGIGDEVTLRIEAEFNEKQD